MLNSNIFCVSLKDFNFEFEKKSVWLDIVEVNVIKINKGEGNRDRHSNEEEKWQFDEKLDENKALFI